MASHSVFVICSEDDKEKVSDLIKGIKGISKDNLFPLSKSQTELADQSKDKILKCDVFVCCLSPNSSQLLFNIVKFARCVAGKKINVYFINLDETDQYLNKMESESYSKYEKIFPKEIEYSSDIGIQNFFKTNRITSFSDLKKVNF